MRSLSLLIGLIAFLLPQGAQTQDTVTIPRARLEELERKAAELDRLKASAPPPGAAQPAPVARQKSIVPAEPLRQDDVLSADELARQFMDSPTEAEARYGDKRILVRGEVVGFDKPAFRKDYAILLQTSERGVRVVCNFVSPSDWKAVFPIRNGSELLITRADGSRAVLSKIGETLLIEGECKGRKDLAIRLGACRIKNRP